jgi:HlyD family secretion protein
MNEIEQMHHTLQINKKKQKKIWIAGVIILFISIGTYYQFFKEKKKEITYTTKTVKKGDIKVIVMASGNLKPTNKVDIGIEVSGTLEKIYVDFNDRVKVGQILAQLDTTKLKSSLQSAKASLEISQANLQTSEVALKRKQEEYKRAQTMYKQSKAQFPSQKDMQNYLYDYEIAQANFNAAKARVSQAAANVHTSEDNLNKAVVLSSVDGFVLDKKVQEGQTVSASTKIPTLFVLAKDLKKMELLVGIHEADIGNIKKDQNVTFRVEAYPSKEFNASVQQIRLNHHLSRGIVTYNTVVEVDNDHGLLKPGMTATASIITKHIKNEWLIPNGAFRYQHHESKKKKQKEAQANSGKSKKSIWIIKKGSKKPVEISVEMIDNDEVMSAVKSDELKAGDEVIIAQSQKSKK